MTTDELGLLANMADILIPPAGPYPSAAAQAGFTDLLPRALDARADAFDIIVTAIEAAPRDRDELEKYLRRMHDHEPESFQPLSAVLAEAWLLTPGVRDRIGYHGQQRHPAGLEDAANDLMDGILEPVLALDDETPLRWAR